MRLHKFAILLLALCLAGCSLGRIVEEPSIPFNETTSPVTQNEQPATSAPTAPTEATAAPEEIYPQATEPASETLPQQTIVQPEPDGDDFVRVKTYIPDLFVDLRYATDDNFTNQRIYDFTDAWLRYGTVKKLILVQEELKQSDLYLKLWDAFRPPAAQFKLWDVCPDPSYVSNPNKGFSSHSRGNTVDITLVYGDGIELVMPTGFDDFSKLADRDYSDCGSEAAANALLLEEVMTKYGFRPYSGEWWHFTDTQSYSVEETFEPVETTLCYADCLEFISLRAKPDTAADVITKILAGEQFYMVARYGEFSLVEYRGLFGYVLSDYLQPIN